MDDASPLLLVRIRPTPAAQNDAHELYKQCRQWWKASFDKAARVERVLAVAAGTVIAAYEPERWERGSGSESGRIAFHGAVATDADTFVGLDLRHLFPHGSANPVRYATLAEVAPAQTASSGVEQPADTVLLHLKHSWRPDLSEAEVYEAARHWWAMSLTRAESLTRVMAVAGGLVRAVYEPEEWMRSPHRGEENRIGFAGRPSDDCDEWIGMDVSTAFPLGSQNPVRYISTHDLLTIARPPAATERDRATAPPPRPEPASTVQPSLVEQLHPLLSAFEEDLLWSMSRAAQELFHSNTLAWLLDNHADAAEPVRALFDDPDHGVTVTDVWREWRHLDLVAQTADTSSGFVVENKLYSVPYAEQLRRYARKPLPWSPKHGPGGAASTRYTLLSLMRPSFTLPEPWHDVSYERLLEALDRVDADLLGDSRDLFHRYRGLVRRLIGLKDAVDPTYDLSSPFSIDTALPGLSTKTFGGHLQRMRFSGLAQAVAEIHQGGPAPSLHVDLSHGKGSLTYQRKIGRTRWLGWQLQESQLRLFVLVQDSQHVGKGVERAASRARVAQAEYADFIDFSTARAILGEHLTPKDFADGDWNRFAPDFVYRYAKVDPNVSTGDLARALSALTTHVDTWQGR